LLLTAARGRFERVFRIVKGDRKLLPDDAVNAHTPQSAELVFQAVEVTVAWRTGARALRLAQLSRVAVGL